MSVDLLETGWVFLNEQVSPVDQKVMNMDVKNNNGVMYVEFETCLHSFDVMNRNSRMYTANNIVNCINSEKIQWYLNHKGWFGEMNHPISYYMDKKLSPERMMDIDMDNTSHKIINPHVKNNLLMSTIQTDAGCDKAGGNLARKMIQGFIPGFSCRAVGKLELIDGKPIVIVKLLVTYDWVLYPSHREAVMSLGSKPSFVNKTAPNQIWINESTSLDIDTHEYSADICCDLKSLLGDIGNKDDKVRNLIESFDLDISDIFNISESGDHVLIKDNNNIVYANVDYKSKSLIQDFMRSI